VQQNTSWENEDSLSRSLYCCL